MSRALCAYLPQIQVREEVIDCAAVVLFFLLIVALPAGSYFYLHRGLVARYEALADTLQQQAVEVPFCTRVNTVLSISRSLSFLPAPLHVGPL